MLSRKLSDMTRLKKMVVIPTLSYYVGNSSSEIINKIKSYNE